MKPGIIKGVGGRRPSPANSVEHYQALTKLMQGKGDEIKVRKVRGPDKVKRRQDEVIIRNDIIKELRRRRIKVKRLENAIFGKNNIGFADLWVVNRARRLAGWMEIKTEKGILTDEQPEFKDDCDYCNIHYWVVRSVVEAVEAVG